MEKTDTLTSEEFIRRLVSMNSNQVNDIIIAIKAGHVMAKRHQKDMAVLKDYRIVPLEGNKEPPLEIIRYKP